MGMATHIRYQDYVCVTSTPDHGSPARLAEDDALTLVTTDETP
jgi:hypothetical protein